MSSIELGQPTNILLNEIRITDEFLYGYDDVDPSFSHWMRLKRESIRQNFIRGLEAQLFNPLLPTETTKRVARALLNLDPTHEIACQKLMCAFVDSGNVVGALAAYKQLWDRLEEEHDIEPTAATQDIVVAIKTGAYAPPIKSGVSGSTVAGSQGLCPITAAVNRRAELRFLPGHPCLL
jgi:DNA-binding SARP family transcriptional activator